jgi:hypothetical protein
MSKAMNGKNAQATGTCLDGFPPVMMSSRKHAELLEKYLKSLSQETVNTIILYDALLTKTYQQIYEGVLFDYYNSDEHCVSVILRASEGKAKKMMKIKITRRNGVIATTWKAFKRSIDDHMGTTLTCGICYEEWTKDGEIPAFWSCHACGGTACHPCADKLNDNCPYCRTARIPSF